MNFVTQLVNIQAEATEFETSMENKEGSLLGTKTQSQKIEQAERKITSLEKQCHKSKQQEKLHYQEILEYHKDAAKLKQELRLAERKNQKFLILIQNTEKQNKDLKVDYFEACSRVRELQVRNRCMADRESFYEKQIESTNKSLRLMERDHTAACRKIGEFHQTRELLEKKRKDAFEELYELRVKNAELEASLQLLKRRKTSLCVEKESESQSKEELMECDRELTSGCTEGRLYLLKREKDTAVEQLHHVEKEALESERRNSELRQQIAEMTLTLTERDHQIRQCKQLFETTKRTYQDEICKLEGSVFHWQTKYEQGFVEMERERMNNGKTENRVTGDHELQLRACQSDVAERDITIAYLQKLKHTHEDTIRQVLNEYQQDICNLKVSTHATTVLDLHGQLRLLLAFYKKRSDNSSAELAKWKELAVEAKLCREKETALFESQLSLISKEYYAKYDIYRESFEREKSQRLDLENQANKLVKELEEVEKQLRLSRKQLDDYKDFHEPSTENNNNITTVIQHQTSDHPVPEDSKQVILMAAVHANQREVLQDQTDRLESQSLLKHENASQRDSQNIVEISTPIEDALNKAADENQAKPVAANKHMESQSNELVNGSNDNKEVFVDDESLNMEVENLRAKNAELQALCERLVRERDEQLAEKNSDMDQQSNDSASNCEAHQNEIQQLKRDIEEASAKELSLEKSNTDLKAENQRLHGLVEELQARVRTLESVLANKVSENSNAMTSETPKDSAEVVQAGADDAQNVEDALNESFAAQDLQDSPEEVPVDFKSPAEVLNDQVIMEEPGESGVSTSEKQTTSLPRSKLPSATSTTAIPFKRHSHAGISHRPNRPRTGSTDISNDRRASFGSDTGDTLPAEDEGKPRFVPKKFSTSHLDAFKPKPFKKQTSLSDDIHLFSRSAGLSSPTKSGSTGSASDSESSHDIEQDSTAHKQPPATLPKPRKPSTETSPQEDVAGELV